MAFDINIWAEAGQEGLEAELWCNGTQDTNVGTLGQIALTENASVDGHYYAHDVSLTSVTDDTYAILITDGLTYITTIMGEVIVVDELTQGDYLEREMDLKATQTSVNTVDTVVDGIQTDLSNGTDGLGAIKTAVDTVDLKVDGVDTVVDGIQTDLDNGTDGLGALKTLIDTIDANVDTVLIDTNDLQTNQGNWLTATGFNTVAPDNASIALILADTNELQTNQGNWLTATGFNTVAPDNASIALILADTNELQTNQGNWLTVTGHATEAKQDIIDTNVDAILVDTGTTIPAQISALNNFDPAADTVANVTLVATTTTNTDMRGTDGANTVVPLAAATDQAEHDATQASIAALNNITVNDIWDELTAGHVTAGSFGVAIKDTLADTNDLQTNQGNWLTATGFNTVAPDNASITAILGDTNELQTNQGNWLTATGFATEAKQDIIDTNVDSILVDTDTMEADIIAHGDANWATGTSLTLGDIADAVWDEASAGHVGSGSFGLLMKAIYDQGTLIYIDTDELQTNQGNWLTATGFSTHSANDVYLEFTSGSNEDVFKADVSGIETKVQADARQVLLIAEHDSTQTDISNLNDFDPALDVVANVTLVGTTTTNTDMRGTDGANTTAPDNASIAAILVDTDTMEADIKSYGDTNWLTATGFNTVVPDNTQGAAVIAHGDGAGAWDGISGLTAADIYTYFTDLSREDLFKADVSGVATQASVDVIDGIVDTILIDTNDLQTNQGNWLTATGFNTVAPDNASIALILADTNELQTNQGNWLTATGFATEAKQDIIDTNVDAILVDTDTLEADLIAHGDANWTGAGTAPTEAQMYTYFTSLSREDAFKAIPDEMTAAELHTALDSYANKADYKADVSGLATQASVDIIDANIDLILADTNELQTNQGNWLTATGFATEANATINKDSIITEIDVNETKIDALAGSVASDVWSFVLATETTAGTASKALIDTENSAHKAKLLSA